MRGSGLPRSGGRAEDSRAIAAFLYTGDMIRAIPVLLLARPSYRSGKESDAGQAVRAYPWGRR